MAFIYYTQFTDPLPLERWEHFSNKIPPQQLEAIERAFRWQDRHARLFGKLLLLKGLQGLGATSDCLAHIQFNQYGRPWLDGDIDFNISHSGGYVLCALALNARVGVDIEKKREIEFDDFKSYMTGEEWQRIHESSDPQHEFFRWWSLKESVMKADGRGFSAPLDQIKIESNRARLDEQTWYFNEVNINPDYCCHLACSDEFQDIHLRRIRFY